MRLLRDQEAGEEELINEIGYLDRQAHGLGRRFFNEVRYAETRIAQFPEAAQEVRPGIRKHMLRTFRYSLIYTIEPDGVLILAVAHQHRRPGYWAGRLTG